MKAAIYDGNKVRIQNVPIPEITSSQALVKVHSSGICGTDLAISAGHLPTPTPIILGHEFSGEIIELGTEIEPKWKGKRVVAEINSNIDHECYYCQRGIPTQCVSRKAIGIDINGALAEYIAVEAYLLHEIPPDISYIDATFIEPLAAAYQTFETMPLDKDDNVIAIFGMGKLGLLILQVAIAKGVEVIAIDGSSKKLELAKKYGASKLINRLRTTEVAQEIMDYSNELGADLVIDTSGNPEALLNVVKACRTRGKIHIKSTHGLATPINLTDIVVREITLYSSRCGPFEKAINGLLSEDIEVSKMISKQYQIEEIEEAFKEYKENRDFIKAIVNF